MIEVETSDSAAMRVMVTYEVGERAGLYVEEGHLFIEDEQGRTIGAHAPARWVRARRKQPGPLFEERLRHLLANAYDGVDPDVETRHEQAAREILALLASPEVTG